MVAKLKRRSELWNCGVKYARWLSIAWCALGAGAAFADETGAETRPAHGHVGGRPDFTWEQLPACELREQIRALKPQARQRAEECLRRFRFPLQDLDSLHVVPEGGIHYACHFQRPAKPPPEPSSDSRQAQAPVPVSPFPAHLIFHSKPGAPNVLYLDFDGESVTGTKWNISLARDPIPAVPFDLDGNTNTFSDAEQAGIKSMWQRVAEDYAPFNIDVTTERPTNFNNNTSHALVTRTTDANGDPNPSATGGGVAFVGVFGTGDYNVHRPCWSYVDTSGSTPSYIAETVSHETGHEMGLSHDGPSYYAGHGSGETFWAPVMGVAWARHVTTWCQGEYFGANNTQDDLAIIAGKLSQRTDDHGNTLGGATALEIDPGGGIVSTTPESDPTNSNPANKGIIENAADVDLFSFRAGAGPLQIVVQPWINPSGTRGGNLDVSCELLDASGIPLATSAPPLSTEASLAAIVPIGDYYLRISGTGAGDPLNNPPTGYTDYASIGQYFISGQIVESHLLVTHQGGGTNVTHNTATLQGYLLDHGGLPTTNDAFWGRVDKGELSGEWETNTVVGPATVGPISLTVTGLLENTVYYYRFRADNGAETDWGEPSVQFFTRGTVPFCDTFEALTNGSVHAQNGWEVSGFSHGESAAAALIQGNQTYGGSAKACMLRNAELRHEFYGPAALNDVTWMDTYMILQPSPDPLNAHLDRMPQSDTAKAVFGVDAETRFVEVLDGEIPLLLTNMPVVPSNEWVRFTVRLERATETWHLWVNSTSVVYNLGFHTTNNPGRSRVRIHEGFGSTSSFVDNVCVSLERPEGILLVDSDGDTMDDDWERTYFLSIGASDGGPDDDWDGDGFIDAHEFRANTIPTDANSLLTIVNAWHDPPNECVIQWQSASNQTYSVQRSTNMPPQNWVSAASNLPASPPLNEHTVSVDKVRSLYRIMLDE